MRVILLIIVLVFNSSARADEKLLGNWKLVSFFTEDVQTKQRNDVYGERPEGFIGFTPAGRSLPFSLRRDARLRKRRRNKPPPTAH
jgi:hypothetical protein